MVDCFEEKFMSIQLEMISMCNALTDGEMDYIYAYGYISDSCTSFNAFFKKNDKTITLGKLGIGTAALMDFLNSGTDSLDKIADLFSENEMQCPIEIKMYYAVETKKFRANYRYEPYDNEDELDSDELFLQWRNSGGEGC